MEANIFKTHFKEFSRIAKRNTKYTKQGKPIISRTDPDYDDTIWEDCRPYLEGSRSLVPPKYDSRKGVFKMKHYYPAVFETTEEGGYIVTIPDIKGCYTEGHTLEEAMWMAQDVIGCCLDELKEDEYPIPSGVNDIDRSKYKDCFVTLVEFDKHVYEERCRAIAIAEARLQNTNPNPHRYDPDTIESVLAVKSVDLAHQEARALGLPRYYYENGYLIEERNGEKKRLKPIPDVSLDFLDEKESK